MKAKELNPNLFPQQEVVKAYEKVGQEYEMTGHDRVYQMHFYPKVTGNPELKEQKIEYRIDQMMRHKDKDGEWLSYFVTLIGNDWEGNIVDYNYIEGKIENMPVFRKQINPQTKEVIPEKTQILELKDIYTIPFTKAKVNELSKYFSDTVGFTVKQRRAGGRRYTCNLEEFRDMEYEELVNLKTGFTDYLRTKQVMAAAAANSQGQLQNYKHLSIHSRK